MDRRIAALLLAVAMALPGGGSAAGGPAQRPPANAVAVTSFAQLSRALVACWVPPPGTEGFEITLRFGLTGQGEVRGKPLATYSVLPGPPDRQRAFVAAAMLALHNCTPVLMSPEFARVAASRVLTLRLVSAGRRAQVQSTGPGRHSG